MKLPRFVTAAFEAVDNPDGTERERIPMGEVDLTNSIAEKADRMRGGFDVERFASDVLIGDISPDLPEDMRKVAWAGRLATPSFREDAIAFVEAIGGVERMPEFKERLDVVKGLERNLERAKETLRDVRAATLVKPSPDIVMFYAPANHDPYVTELEDAYSGLEWDAYVKTHPRPAEFEGPVYDAWIAGLRDAPRVAPLHVFATLPSHWAGLDPAFVRSEVADAIEGAAEAEAERLADIASGKPARERPIVATPFDVEEHFYSDLQDHYEDAHRDVVDLDGVCAILDAWEPHAGKGTPEDLALEGKLAEWNARQTIVSYGADMTRILSIYGDDHATIVARCEKDVLALEEAVEAASVWEERQPEAAPAP